MKREDILSVYALGPQALCDFVLGAFSVLEARIVELENRLAKDSSNSSKPPSSDGLKRTTSLRSNTSGRKPGGQPGHPGQTLLQTTKPDKIVELPLVQCPQCGTSLEGVAAVEPEKRQVFDLPPQSIVVTEYQAARKRCPGCGGMHSAPFPEAVKAPVQYGPNFTAVMAHLHGTHMLPCERTAELCGELFGHQPSVGAVLSSMCQAAAGMEPTVSAIAAALKQADVAHADETGIRCEGKTRWLHVCCTSLLTHLSFGGQRGAKGMAAADILSQRAGVLVHDFWAAYLGLPCKHSYCNAHLLRELKAMKELNGHAWGGELSAVLVEMKAAAEAAIDNGTKQVPAALHEALHERYDKLLAAALQEHPINHQRKPGQKAGRTKQSPEHSLLNRLHEHRNEVLRFFDEPGIPFDNNQAERDLRMMKVQQKTSGCFRSEAGAKTFCTLRSYVSTAKKHGINLLESITNAVLGKPFLLSG